MHHNRYLIIISLLVAFALAGWFTGSEGLRAVLFAALTAVLAFALGLGLRFARRAFQQRNYSALARLPVFIAALPVYLLVSVWLFRPEILPVDAYYNFIDNRKVTERLVDPAMLKIEWWDIMGDERRVLFVHPSGSGSTALVYPVKIKPFTHLSTALAIAPQAWGQEGDGVAFSVYVEDDAGIHLLYSRYVDPKHHQEDRRWLPLQLSLTRYSNKLVRVILVTNSGPAGDLRYDWSGWAEPILVRPTWP